MAEKPEIQYSKHKEENKDWAVKLTRARQDLSAQEGEIEAEKLKLDQLRSGQGDIYKRLLESSTDMSEEDRATYIHKKIEIYEKILNAGIDNSRILREYISGIEMVMEINVMLENDWKEDLLKGEGVDEVTGDIDQEDKPPQKLN